MYNYYRHNCYNPNDMDEPEPIFCERCGDEIETARIDLFEGEPYCETCKAEMIDEGDDEGWTNTTAQIYIEDVKSSRLAAAADRAYDEMRAGER